MADTKISDLTALTGANSASTDLATVVDVSDTTYAASGTNKKMTLAELAAGLITHGAIATDAELAAHTGDTTAAHAASAISADSATLVGVGTDVQAVLEELDNGIADHLADGTAAHAASAISFSAVGTIAGTDVQTAVAEVATDAASALSSHESDTTSIHGISDTSALALTADVVTKALFDAHTVLAATSDNTPAALTVGEQTLVGRITAGNIAALSASQVRTLLDVPTNAEAVLDSLFDAHTVVYATSDNTPAALTVGEEKVVGRITGGNIAAVNPSAIAQDINTQTDSYTLVIGDAGKLIEMNKGTANNLTVPQNSSVAFPVGTRIDVVQYGAGATTLVQDTNVTIRVNASLTLVLDGQYAVATLYKRATNEWVVAGQLVAA